MRTCVLRLVCFLLACLVLYLVSPFSFQPFLMFTSALNERSRSNPLCDFRLGTVVTSDYETPLTVPVPSNPLQSITLSSWSPHCCRSGGTKSTSCVGGLKLVAALGSNPFHVVHLALAFFVTLSKGTFSLVLWSVWISQDRSLDPLDKNLTALKRFVHLCFRGSNPSTLVQNVFRALPPSPRKFPSSPTLWIISSTS